MMREALCPHVVRDRLAAHFQPDDGSTADTEHRADVEEVSRRRLPERGAVRQRLAAGRMRARVQLPDLLDRLGELPYPMRGLAQREPVREREGLVERHAGHLDSRPPDLNAPSVRRMVEGLGRIVGPVEALVFSLVVGNELLAVEAPNRILTVGGRKHPLGDLRRLPIRPEHGQLVDLRAFEPDADVAFALPVQQILRGVERNVQAALAGVVEDRHHPPALAAVGRLVPDHLRVAARMAHDRIALVVRERATTVRAVADRFAASGVREERDDRLLFALLKSGHVFLVHDRAAREAMLLRHRIRIERQRQFFPVHQVAADRVPPEPVGADPVVRVVLGEQVILAVVVDHAVRIVVPARSLAVVELRAELLVVEPLAVYMLVGLVDRPQPALPRRRVGLDRERHFLSLEAPRVPRHPELGLLPRHAKVQHVHELAVHEHMHRHDMRRLPNRREVDVVLRDLHRAGQQRQRTRLADLAALVDVVHEDVPHAADVMVEELDNRLLPFQVGDIPVLPEEDLGVYLVTETVLPGVGRRRSRGLAAHQEPYARLPGESAPADHEVDVLALDLKRRRRQLSRPLLVAVVGIGQALALVAGGRGLTGQHSLRRPFAERIALRLPAFPVPLPLEIGDQDVGRGRGLGGPAGPGGARGERSAKQDEPQARFRKS